MLRGKGEIPYISWISALPLLFKGRVGRGYDGPGRRHIYTFKTPSFPRRIFKKHGLSCQ